MGSGCWFPPEEIDEINILKASFLAMHRAIDQLKVCPEVPHYRWQPLHSLSEFALYAHCKRRLKVFVYCRSKYSCEDLSR